MVKPVFIQKANSWTVSIFSSLFLRVKLQKYFCPAVCRYFLGHKIYVDFAVTLQRTCVMHHISARFDPTQPAFTSYIQYSMRGAL